MSTKIAQLEELLQQEPQAASVSQLWDKYNMQRQTKINEWSEVRNFLFATDTSTTTNSTLPWHNKTTVPKLCQIRDNLHSNYMAALFPNDDWLSWEAYSREGANKTKASAIEAYMANKCRQSHFETETSKLVYDYIDYGNAFATVDWKVIYKTNDLTKEKIVDYIGPAIRRISPMDIVMNPIANSFKDSYKIVRSVYSCGDLQQKALEEPEQAFWTKALERREKIGVELTRGGYSWEDFQKSIGYSCDGFGDMYEYFMSDMMEVLEFYGSYRDEEGKIHSNKIITVCDRGYVARIVDIPTWYASAPIWHIGWRFRPDNLWAMGPLDNLVGMQYRIDHLENAKADAVDLIVNPPLKIIGEVENFVWGPSSEIHLDEGGDVVPLSQNLNHIVTMVNEIQGYEDRMELYAGAPREAMGIRTPGEKTAFEVQQLNNAAQRIFEEKARQFEVELLEPALNGMLESSRRNMDTSDMIRVMDDDLGVQQFMEISKDDITAAGKLRPVGARHFAKQAQDLQNLIGVFNSPIAQMIAPHTSALAMTDFINDVVDLRAYKIFQPNVAVNEQYETQSLANQAQEDLMVQQQTPTEAA